jgi:N-methylhydantoinase B
MSSAQIGGESDSRTEVRSQVIWNRLLALVEESAQTLMRTAFSSTVREAGDLCTGLFDLQGRMLAQAVTGTPGHVNTMAEAVKHLLARLFLRWRKVTSTSPTIPGSPPVTCTI